MARLNFNSVMEVIFRHEGGYVDHPRDPGGATNFGITHKTLAKARGVHRVSKEEVKRLSKKEAMQIYERYYWWPLKGDALNHGYDLVAMDGGVNSGVIRGAKWLQIGVGAKADGIIGPKTLRAVNKAGGDGIIRACEARMSFLRVLTHWKTFGRGWTRRVAETEAAAMRMFSRNSKSALEHYLDTSTSLAKKEPVKGTAQSGGVAAGTIATLQEIPSGVWVMGTAITVLIILIILRSWRRTVYQQERAAAYRKELEEMP